MPGAADQAPAAPPVDMDVAVAKYRLTHLYMATSMYLESKTGLSHQDLKLGLDGGAANRAAVALCRTAFARLRAEGRDRSRGVILLLWLCRREGRRLASWTSGPPPFASIGDVWSGPTLMPTLEVWRYESSGGGAKRWTLRRRSEITKVDAALEAWWTEFQWLQRDAAVDKLDALKAACDAYLAHKDEAKTTERAALKARLGAVRRLAFRAGQERLRLDVGWDDLLPPRVAAFATERVPDDFDPLAAGGDAMMELRTILPTFAVWSARSAVTGAIRRRSRVIELVDEPLKRFWKAFSGNQRAESLLLLGQLVASCALYSQGATTNTSGGRLEAVKELGDQAQEEWDRLKLQWPASGSTLPPFVRDNDASVAPAVEADVAADLQEMERELDPAAMRAVDAKAVSAFCSASVPSSAGQLDRSLAAALGDKSGSIFGHDKAYVQIVIAPEEASENLFKLYRAEKKWVQRQLAAIQAGSVVQYVTGIEAMLARKPPSVETDALRARYLRFFKDVISVADHVAEELYAGNVSSAWRSLEALRWDEEARPLVLPMTGICTILYVCKWRATKTGAVRLGIREYGAPKAVVTAVGLGLSVVTACESAKQMVETQLMGKAVGSNFLPRTDLGGNATNAGLSVFGAVGAAISIPSDLLSIYNAVQAHRGLTTIAERFAALETALPGVVQLIDASPFFYRLRLALMGKLGRRQTRARIEAAGGAVSIASTVVGAYITITVANAWNPLGWTLSAMASVASVGMIIYKLQRWWSHTRYLAELRQRYNIPSFVETSGEWDRYMIADLMYRAALNDTTMGHELLSIGYALMFLVFGGDLVEARQSVLNLGHGGVMAFIKG